MATSPVSFFAPTTSIIPPPVTIPQIPASSPFLDALQGTQANAATTPLNTFPALSPQSQFIATLERSLFSDWTTGLQPIGGNSLGPAIESILANALGLTGPIPAESRGVPFDASNPASVAITSQILSLFGSIQSLGTGASPTPTIGSILDLAA